MALNFRAPTAAASLILLPTIPAAADIPLVRHVVIIVQENRSIDNLFHGLNRVLPKADIADSGVDSNGDTIRLKAVALANNYDLIHEHSAFKAMYDHGKMDGADLIGCKANPNVTCPSYPQFKFVDPTDVAPYFHIAVNYGFANRMFQSNQGPSFPAHQFILGGTSAPGPNSADFAAENPTNGNHTRDTGCLAPPFERVAVIGPDGQENRLIYPCFEHRTMTDLIDAKTGLTWRYYTPNIGSIWTAPNAIRHMCEPSGSPLRCMNPDWLKQNKIVLKPAAILQDVAAKSLPTVSWVIPTGNSSDHARINDGSGP